MLLQTLASRLISLLKCLRFFLERNRLPAQSRRLFFEDLAARWDSLQDPNRSKRLQHLLGRFVHLWPETLAILEVGTGTGALLPLLRDYAPQARLIAVDLARAMLQRASRRGSQAHLCQADAHYLPFRPHSFQVIVCHGVFPHFENKPQVLAELRRALQPGGQLVILHDISREQVNAIHRSLPAPLSDDLIPPADQMRAWLDRAGFVDAQAEDTPDYYLAVGRLWSMSVDQPEDCR
jgi:ubiquinone/menaquinone biosynthesis C-methylase UbiE